MPDQARNLVIMDALVTSWHNIERAEKRGDHECKKERHEFRKLFSEILALLDNVKPPFKTGDQVRLKPKAAKKRNEWGNDLQADQIFVVWDCFYEGRGDWMLVFTIMPKSSMGEYIGFGAQQFEKVKVIRAA